MGGRGVSSKRPQGSDDRGEAGSAIPSPCPVPSGCWQGLVPLCLWHTHRGPPTPWGMLSSDVPPCRAPGRAPACHRAAPPLLAPQPQSWGPLAPTDRPACRAEPSAAAGLGPSRHVPGAHRVGRAPSQNGAPADPDPADPAPGLWSPRRGNQSLPASGWLFCSFCLLYCPRRGCRVDGLRPVRFPSERGEPRRFTATATSAHAAAVKRDPPDPMWTPALPEGGHLRPPAPAPATEPACPTPRSPQQRPDRRSGLGAQRETGGTQDSSLLWDQGRGKEEKGDRAGGQCGLRSCTGLTRSPPNPRPPRTSERYMKLRPWPMALVRMRSHVTEGER